MLEFIILMVILDILSKIVVGTKECEVEDSVNDDWYFKNVDDCMEFRELRATGWKGNARDFYAQRDSD